MRRPLILLVKRAYNAIVDDLPRGSVLEDGKIQASSHIGLPEKTVREAIVNALILIIQEINLVYVCCCIIPFVRRISNGWLDSIILT